MKTRHIYGGLVMTAAALLCLAGCKKDEEGEKIMLGTQFEKAVSAQKTYLNENNYVCWSTGEKVKVNDNADCEVSAEGVAVAEADNYYAVYPATNTVGKEGGTVEIPATQTYTLDEQSGKQVLNGPMAARLDGKSGKLYFRNLYSLLKVTVAADGKDFTVNSITVTATGETPKALAGSYTFEFNGATTTEAPTVNEITSGSNSVTLNCGSTTVNANNDMDFYIVVHPMVAQKLTVKVNGVLDGKRVVYTYNTLSERTLNRSRIGGLAVNLQQLQPKELGFSVDDGRTVEFAPGNLQYLASPERWRFAEHQYDYIGANEGNTTAEASRATQTYWIDLFSWGTSGYNDNYPPYMTSQTNMDNYNCDWGVYNAIYNPKTGTTDNPGTWRTLTKDEWAYLLGTSESTRGDGHTDWWIYNMVKIKAADGTNDVMGLIIYPDGVTEDITGKLSSKSGRNGTEISKAEFETLEAMGCVFLPAAGYRNGISVGGAGSFGYYWSSTYGNDIFAYNLYFGSDGVSPASEDRYYGHSVRLVKDL